MPTNVEVLVSFETFGNVITANANTTAYQHLDHIYSNTIVYQIPADPLLTITQFSMIAVAGGGGNQYGGFGAGGFGSNSNLIAQYGSVYSVTVGGPGNGASNGGISSVYGPNVSFSLLGGGYGGGGNGNPGGSGGGAGGYASVGSGTAGQGNPGGGGGDPRYGAFAGGGGGFGGGGGGAWAYFHGGGGGGFTTDISGQSNTYAYGGGGGGGPGTSVTGVVYFSYPTASGFAGSGGSNSYLVNPNTRVHQFTTSGTFTLPGPPLATDGSIVRAQSNTTIKVNRLTINNPNNANVRCNVWYRNERNNTNTYIVFNRFISANSSVTLIDKNNPVYVANLSALVGSYQTGVGF